MDNRKSGVIRVVYDPYNKRWTVPIQIPIQRLDFLFLLVAGRYNALLPNGHLRDCHICNGIVFPFIIWFYGSAIVIIRGWGGGFGSSEDIVTWSDNRPSFTVLEFMAVVAYCRGI
jgi:hypothetical protein